MNLRPARQRRFRRIREVPPGHVKKPSDVIPRVRKGGRLIGDLRSAAPDYASLRIARERKRKLKKVNKWQRRLGQKVKTVATDQFEQERILNPDLNESVIFSYTRSANEAIHNSTRKRRAKARGLMESAERMSEPSTSRVRAPVRRPGSLVNVLVDKHNLGKKWRPIVQRMVDEGLIELIPETNLRAELAAAIAPHNSRASDAIKNERKVRLPRGRHKLIPLFRLISASNSK